MPRSTNAQEIRNNNMPNHEAQTNSTWEQMGYQFILSMVSFLIHFVGDGVTLTYGLFYSALVREFDSAPNAGFIGSLLAAIPLLTASLSAIILQKYGCRKVIIAGGLISSAGVFFSSYSNSLSVLTWTFGVATGVGLSLSFMAGPALITHNFNKHLSLAMGFSTCGGGIGTFTFAPTTQYLLDWHGRRIAARALSVCFFAVAFGGFLIKEEVKKKSSSSSNSSKQIDNAERLSTNSRGGRCSTVQNRFKKGMGNLVKELYSIWKSICQECKTAWKLLGNVTFLFLCISNLIYYACYDIPFLFVQMSATENNIPLSVSSWLIATIGLFNIVGHIVLGYLGDQKWINIWGLYITCALLSGISTSLIPWAIKWNYFAAFTTCAVVGFTVSGNLTLIPAMIIELFGKHLFETSFGVVSFFQGVGNLAGPPSASYLSVRTGSYDLSYWLAGGGMSIASVLCMIRIFVKHPTVDNDGGNNAMEMTVNNEDGHKNQV